MRVTSHRVTIYEYLIRMISLFQTLNESCTTIQPYTDFSSWVDLDRPLHELLPYQVLIFTLFPLNTHRYTPTHPFPTLSATLASPSPHRSLIPTNHVASPNGHVCLTFPLSNLHPTLQSASTASTSSINLKISPLFLVRMQLTTPSNTTTLGTTGTTYVQNKCTQSPQK